jgi:hypothetical protein
MGVRHGCLQHVRVQKGKWRVALRR